MPKWAIKMWHEPDSWWLVVCCLTGLVLWYVGALVAAATAMHWLFQHVRIVLV